MKWKMQASGHSSGDESGLDDYDDSEDSANHELRNHDESCIVQLKTI